MSKKRVGTVEGALRFISCVQTRPSVRNLWPQLLGKKNPYPRQVIEIRGESKRAVKLILMEICARIGFPDSSNVHISGRDGSILYINCDENPIIDSFRDYLQKVVARYFTKVDTVNAIVGSTVDKLIVVDPKNMAPNSASYCKFEDLIIDKADICIVVIDSIDGYSPETSGQPTGKEATYMDKVSYLKLVLEEINVVTIYLRRDLSNALPPKEIFTDVDTVLICNDFGPLDGIIVNFCEKDKQYEVVFSEEAMLHNI